MASNTGEGKKSSMIKAFFTTSKCSVLPGSFSILYLNDMPCKVGCAPLLKVDLY